MTKSSHKYLSMLPALLAAAALFLFIAPFFPSFAGGIGLDSAWIIGLNQGYAEGLVFGRDLVFTFGPYASVYSREYNPGTNTIALFGSFCLATAFVVQFLRWALRDERRMLPVWVVMAVIALFNQKDAVFLIYPTLLTLWALRRYGGSQPAGRLDLALFVIQVAALGLLPLTKGSMIAPIIVTVGLLAYFFRRVGLPRHALVVLAVPPVACVVFWLLSGQPLGSIVDYYRTMLPIVSGYTGAMSSTGPVGEILLFVVGALALVLTDLHFGRGDDTLVRRIRLLALLLVLFMGFKAGFVRHDGHAIMSGHVLALCALLVLMFSRKSSVTALVLCVAVLVIIDARYINTSTAKAVDALQSVVEKTQFGIDNRILQPGGLDRIYTEKMGELAARCDIPDVSGSVDVYSFGQACVVAKGLKWLPRPVFQSYSAYTPDLIRMNAEHLQGDRAAQNLLFRIEPIDRRLPSLEDGYSWPVIASRYTLNRYEKEYAVFTRREQTEKLGDYVQIAEGTGQIGETVKLPASGPVYASLDVRPTLIGKLVSVLFKLPSLNIQVDLPGDLKKSYRFIPGMAQTPFVISPLVDTTGDFVLFMEQNRGYLASARVSGLRIVGEGFWSGLLWRQQFAYSFQRIDVPAQTRVSESMFSRPVEAGGQAIDDWKVSSCDGSVDTLNGMSPVPHPAVRITGNLALEGWAAVSAQNGIAAEQIYVAVRQADGQTKVYSTTRRDRADVGAHFKQSALNHSGYAAYIDTTGFSDRFSFGIVTMHKGEAVLCAPVRNVEMVR
jgi:hypothetical protein